MTDHAISIDGLIAASEGLKNVVTRAEVEERRWTAVETQRGREKERERDRERDRGRLRGGSGSTSGSGSGGGGGGGGGGTGDELRVQEPRPFEG